MIHNIDNIVIDQLVIETKYECFLKFNKILNKYLQIQLIANIIKNVDSKLNSKPVISYELAYSVSSVSEDIKKQILNTFKK